MAKPLHIEKVMKTMNWNTRGKRIYFVDRLGWQLWHNDGFGWYWKA